MRLLEAEKEVNAKVHKAQQEKNALLMSIKKEADIQVEAYRVQAEQQFQKDLAAVSLIVYLTSPVLQKEREINDKAREQDANNPTMTIAQAQADYEANKERVIDMLIKSIVKVDVEIPRVLKGDFDKLI